MAANPFDGSPIDRAARKKLGPVDPNFRVFCAGWLGDNPELWEIMEVTGAVFRAAQTGPRRGQMVIEVPRTRRTVYVTAAELKAAEEPT